MTFDDIQQIILQGESRTLELKKTTGELKDAMHTACAFLNTSGGWLIFGVAPKSLKIVGQDVTDNTQQEIALALSNLEPRIEIPVFYIDVPETKGKKLIVMHFEGFAWGREPFTYHGCPYYKVESTTKEMPRDMYKERLYASRPKFYSWELQEADRVSIDDMDEQRIRGAIRLGIENGRMLPNALTMPLSEILRKWSLYTDGGKLNNAAAMLFGKNLTHYPQCRLRLARFRGNNKNEFIDNQLAEGNFFDLLNAGMAFFLKHLNLSSKIVGFNRVEHLDVPAPALREALTNALCHRQFEKYNLTPSIAIYDNRIDISNPGVFPPQITPETMPMPHESYPYNRTMAEVLYKTTFLESWGSGARRIIEACQAQGVDAPTWSISGSFVVATFHRPTGVQVDPINAKIDPINTKTDPINIKTDPINAQVDPIKQMLLKEIQLDGHYTYAEYGAIIGVSPATVKRRLSEMKSEGLIVRIGSNKSGYWVITQ